MKFSAKYLLVCPGHIGCPQLEIAVHAEVDPEAIAIATSMLRAMGSASYSRGYLYEMDESPDTKPLVVAKFDAVTRTSVSLVP